MVTALGAARPGAHEIEVDVDGERATAIAYPELVGPVTVGDTVILNTTAVALGLGTGGVHFVIAVEGVSPTDDEPPGRVMKARYTPVQTAVTSVEETHRDVLEGSRGLELTPVVCAPLHSMVAPVAAGARRAGASSRRLRDDGRSRAAGRLLEARLRAPRSRAVGRLDHVRSGVRRRARGRHGVDGHAGGQGGDGRRRDRGGRWAGQPGHRHHLGRERPGERQRPERRRHARGPPDPRAPRELRGPARTPPGPVASLPHDPARRLQGRSERSGPDPAWTTGSGRPCGVRCARRSSRNGISWWRWTDGRRSRSSMPAGSSRDPWVGPSRTTPRSSWRPGRPACWPAAWPRATVAGAAETETETS